MLVWRRETARVVVMLRETRDLAATLVRVLPMELSADASNGRDRNDAAILISGDLVQVGKEEDVIVHPKAPYLRGQQLHRSFLHLLPFGDVFSLYSHLPLATMPRLTSTHLALRDAFLNVLGASVRPSPSAAILPRPARSGRRSASQTAYNGGSRIDRLDSAQDDFQLHGNSATLSGFLLGLPSSSIVPPQDHSFPSLPSPPSTPSSSLPAPAAISSTDLDTRLKRASIVLTPTRHPLGSLLPRARRRFRLYGDIVGGMSLLARSLRRYERLQTRMAKAGITFDDLVSAGKWIPRKEVQETLVTIMGDLVAALSPVAYQRHSSSGSSSDKYLRTWHPAVLAAQGITEIPADWTPTTLALCAATEVFDQFFSPFSLPSNVGTVHTTNHSSPPLPPSRAAAVVLHLFTRAVLDPETLLRACDRVSHLYAGELQSDAQQQEILDLRKALATAYAASGQLQRAEDLMQQPEEHLRSVDMRSSAKDAAPAPEEIQATISLYTTRINLAAVARDMERAAATLQSYREWLSSLQLQSLSGSGYAKKESLPADAPYLALMRASAAQLDASSLAASHDPVADSCRDATHGRIGSAGQIKRFAVTLVVQHMCEDGVSPSLATLEFLIPFYASGRCWDDLGESLMELHERFSPILEEGRATRGGGEMELSTYRACFRAQYQLICARSSSSAGEEEAAGAPEAAIQRLFARLAMVNSKSLGMVKVASSADSTARGSGALYLLAPTSLWRTGLAPLIASLSPAPSPSASHLSTPRSPARHTASLSKLCVSALNEALRTLLAIHDLSGAREVLHAFDAARLAPDQKTCRFVLLACARRDGRASEWADTNEDGGPGNDAYERIMGRGGLGEVLERRLERDEGERSTAQTLVDLLNAAHVA